MKTLIATTAIVMAMAMPTFADGPHPHQVTAPHQHGSSRDPSVGVNDLHHHHADGSRHYLVCAAAVPYPGYARINVLYLRDNGTYLLVVRVEGGLLHIRYDENCEVTSRSFVRVGGSGNDSTTPTPTPDTPNDDGPTDDDSDDDSNDDSDDDSNDDSDDEADEDDNDGPKTGCNGKGCEPGSGGGNSEGNESSDQDED